MQIELGVLLQNLDIVPLVFGSFCSIQAGVPVVMLFIKGQKLFTIVAVLVYAMYFCIIIFQIPEDITAMHPLEDMDIWKQNYINPKLPYTNTKEHRVFVLGLEYPEG